jgi:hypothetical protein
MPTLQSATRTAAPGPEPRLRTGHALLLAAVGPVLTGYLGIAAVLALATATAPGATLSTSGVLHAAGPAWLAVYHVPVVITGHELGMLPLLPTALVLALVARSAANAARRLDWYTPRCAVKVISAVAAAHAVFGTAVAVLCLHWTVSASPAVACCMPAALAALAATLGTARQCGLVDAVLDRTAPATETGLRAGLLAVIGLTAVGTLAFAVGLVMSWSSVTQLFHAAAPGAGAGLGMFLLCLAYLPNVVIGTLSFVAGPGFTLGGYALAQWHFHVGPVPAVPLLGPLPAAIGDWWFALVMLPAAIGVLVGLVCRAAPGGGAAQLRAVGVAALGAGVTWLVLAALAGGALADGPFDPVTVPAGALAVAVCLLIAVPGAVTVWTSGRHRAAPDLEPLPEPEPDDEDAPEPTEDGDSLDDSQIGDTEAENDESDEDSAESE